MEIYRDTEGQRDMEIKTYTYIYIYIYIDGSLCDTFFTNFYMESWVALSPSRFRI